MIDFENHFQLPAPEGVLASLYLKVQGETDQPSSVPHVDWLKTPAPTTDSAGRPLTREQIERYKSSVFSGRVPDPHDWSRQSSIREFED